MTDTWKIFTILAKITQRQRICSKHWWINIFMQLLLYIFQCFYIPPLPLHMNIFYGWPFLSVLYNLRKQYHVMCSIHSVSHHHHSWNYAKTMFAKITKKLHSTVLMSYTFQWAQQPKRTQKSQVYINNTSLIDILLKTHNAIKLYKLVISGD